MSAIDKVVAHYQAGFNHFEVPEWDTTVYFYPVSVGAQSRIRELVSDKANELQVNAAVVAINALDAQGQRLYSDEDMEKLVNEADREVVINVAARILGLLNPDGSEPDTVEQAKKNS